ncbi:MAG: glucokinase [Asticcacaulis sp.]
MPDPVLLCDFVVGSYVKLALAEPGERPGPVAVYNCADDGDFHDALTDFLDINGNPDLRGAAVASRGWDDQGVVHLPGSTISLSREQLRESLSVQRVNLVNNFVARALAIPRLHEGEAEKICGLEAGHEQVIAVLGPHQGLGVAALAPDGVGGWTAVPCEGGHSDLPATSEREIEVVDMLRRRHGHVSRETVLSIKGLAQLWQALSALEGREPAQATAADIIAMAREGDAVAGEAVEMCVGWLAGMASDVGLIMGARGGIYLTGDLMDLLDGVFDSDAFRKRYADKGRLSAYVSEIPVYRTRALDLEILGLATLFE